MPSLARRQHDAYRSRAQLRGLASVKAVRSPVDDEDALDRSFAELALANPSHYPDFRGMSLEQVVRIVRSLRLGAGTTPARR
jgi:hypothetical protein